MEVAQTARLADWRVRHQSSLDEARYNVRVFFKDKLAVAGLIIILFTITIALIGPWIAPYPAQGRGDSNLVGAAPGPERQASPRHRQLRSRHPQPRDLRRAHPAHDLLHHHGRHRPHRRAHRRHRRLLRGQIRRSGDADLRRVPGVPVADPRHRVRGVPRAQHPQRDDRHRPLVVALVHEARTRHGGLFARAPVHRGREDDGRRETSPSSRVTSSPTRSGRSSCR